MSIQLLSLVEYHRALSDPARIRILFLLGRKSMNGLELSECLGLSTATVSHHMTKLREVGVVSEGREGNSIRFELQIDKVKQGAGGIVQFLTEAKEFEEVQCEMEKSYEKQRDSVRKAFFNDGKLKQIPMKYKKRLIVLEEIIDGLESGRKYKEDEINEHIMQFFEDYSTIRREFIVNHMMYRDKGIYELNPREMWTDWRKLR